MAQTVAPQTIAFIGLGTMGFFMAGHLSDHYDVIVYNRTVKKAEKWLNCYHGKRTETISQAVALADMVIICVGDDSDLREVMSAKDGILDGLRPGTCVIDHSTTSATVAQEVAILVEQAKGYFFDAPVSGGQVGAQKGQLTIMAGGPKELFSVLQPVLQHYACSLIHMGENGSGQQTKMVNQICIAGLLQALSEGLALSRRMNLDSQKMFHVLTKGAAASWQMQNRTATMLSDEFDFGFSVDLMRKDLRICLEESEKYHLDLPVSALVDQFYKKLQCLGYGHEDTSSLIRLLGKESGESQ